MARKHFLSQGQLLASVREYLLSDPLIRLLQPDGRPGPIWPAESLEESTFYLFDSDSAMAYCRAIEDLAFEDANGRVFAAMQSFRAFEPHRERYMQLAATVDGVQVLAAGELPARVRRVAFLKDPQARCQRYLVLAYEGHFHQICFAARETDNASGSPPSFRGFYTCNPKVVRRLCQDMAGLAQGRTTAPAEFLRQEQIDLAARQLKRELAHQAACLQQALDRLRRDGDQYPSGRFASDIERGVNALAQWKKSVPRLVQPPHLSR